MFRNLQLYILCSRSENIYLIFFLNIIEQAIGVDRIFIADDCSKDKRTPAILEALASQNKITYLKAATISFLHNCSSTSYEPNEALHFSHLFSLARNTCKWITSIDVDEYMFPVDGSAYKIRFLPILLAKVLLYYYRLLYLCM